MRNYTKEPPHKLQKLRVRFLLRNPFLGMLTTSLELAFNEEIQTACTNGEFMHWNEEYYDKCTHAENEGVMMHEDLHVMFKHHIVLASTPWMTCPKTFNVGADIIINQLVLDEGYTLPEGAITAYNWPGGPKEFIHIASLNIYEAYRYLEQKYQPPKPPPDQPSDDEGDTGIGGGSKPSDNDPDGDQKTKGKGGSTPEDKPELPDHTSTGDVEPWKVQDTDEDGEPVGEPREPTQEECEQESEHINKRIAQARSSAKMQGKMSAGMDRLVEEMLRPRIKWTMRLSREMAQHARTDYSWMRPNRRFIHQGLYLPSLTGTTLGDFGWITDTSCSVDQPTLDEINSEAWGLLSKHEGRMHCLSVDAEVKHYELITNKSGFVKPTWKGGGGTSYRPGFRWLKENVKRKLNFLVYATDGYCDRFPDEHPNYPVYWVVWDDVPFNPPFGQVIYVN